MYLLIYPNGRIRKIEEPGEDDYALTDGGDLQILDIDGCDEPALYVGGDWEAVAEADEEM